MKRVERSLNLRELQEWMRWIITDPRGVEAALAEKIPDADPRDLPRYLEPIPSALDCISGDEKLGVTERLDIYAEGYFARILEALESDYKRVKELVGEYGFQKLIADYLKRHPSRYKNIGEIGRELPNFISTHEMSREFKSLKVVSDLEWNATECFYSDDGNEFDPSAFLSLKECDWPRLKIVFSRSIRILSSRLPLVEIWNERLPPVKFAGIDGGSEQFYLMSCVEGVVTVRSASPNEAVAIESFRRGETLAQVLERVQAQSNDGTLEVGLSEDLMRFFGSWTSERLITGITHRG